MKISTQKIKNLKINNANRGMLLEKILNESNEYYLLHNKAVIHKKPTPIQVVNVNYSSRSEVTISKAFFKTPSTTDYNGIYQGYHIDFEAKTTNSKTSFPLSNIHEHQLFHLEKINQHGGITFLIVAFSYYGEYYLLPFNLINSYWKKSYKDGPKSIKYEIIKEQGFLIKEKYKPRLDYLEVLDEKILKN